MARTPTAADQPATPGIAADPAPGRLPPARGRRPARRRAGGRTGAAAAGLAGLVSAGAALATGELVAGLDPRLRWPVEAVAGEVIDRAPRPVERFAIETFGTADKLALVVGTLALSALLGAALGAVARRRPLAGAVGFGGFAVLGAAASLAAPGASPLSAVPALAAGVAGVACLQVLVPRPGVPVAPPPSPLTAGAWARAGRSSG